MKTDTYSETESEGAHAYTKQATGWCTCHANDERPSLRKSSSPAAMLAGDVCIGDSDASNGHMNASGTDGSMGGTGARGNPMWRHSPGNRYLRVM